MRTRCATERGGIEEEAEARAHSLGRSTVRDGDRAEAPDANTSAEGHPQRPADANRVAGWLGRGGYVRQHPATTFAR
jgi:hypothetical protein